MSYEAWGEPDDSPFDAALEAGWINPDDTSKAIIDVMNERDRQWNEEGFTGEHDDAANADGQLVQAAEAYLAHNNIPENERARVVSWSFWPWDPAWWKPKDRRKDLVRAAALIVAEIERMDRIEKRAQQQGERA